MNLLSIQDALKNASDQQLVQLMRAPDSTTPSYLVVSELNRRKQMRAKQAEPPSRTVAEDLTSEENMQAPMGIRSLQTPEPGDEDYPTEEDAPGIEAMREGGVIRMAAGTPDGVQGEDERSRAGQFWDYATGRWRSALEAAPRVIEGNIETARRGLENNPYTYFFGSPSRQAQASAEQQYLIDNAGRIRLGEFDMEAFRRDPAGYMRDNPTGPRSTTTTPPAPTEGRPAPAPAQTLPLPPEPPRGGPPASGVRALTPSAAPAAAAPEGLPTLQQNMERNLGMFPGIPQELMDRIRDSRTNEGDRRREAQNMALLEAGLRIAGSNNPNFLGAIGEGAAPAAQTYAQQLSQIRQDRRSDIQTDLAVAQADLQRRYMAGQISASELQRQTQMLISREERASRLEAARIAAGGADARAERLERLRMERDNTRYEQGIDRAQAERTAQEVNKALMDQGTRGAARVALRGTNPRAEITDAQIDSYIENRVTGMMDRAYARARGLPTSNTTRDNASVVQPPGAR
jgi:hypothetical protein